VGGQGGDAAPPQKVIKFVSGGTVMERRRRKVEPSAQEKGEGVMKTPILGHKSGGSDFSNEKKNRMNEKNGPK